MPRRDGLGGQRIRAVTDGFGNRGGSVCVLTRIEVHAVGRLPRSQDRRVQPECVAQIATGTCGLEESAMCADVKPRASNRLMVCSWTRCTAS